MGAFWRVTLHDRTPARWVTVSLLPSHYTVGLVALAAARAFGLFSAIEPELDLFHIKNKEEVPPKHQPTKEECDAAVLRSAILSAAKVGDPTAPEAVLPDGCWLVLKVTPWSAAAQAFPQLSEGSALEKAIHSMGAILTDILLTTLPGAVAAALNDQLQTDNLPEASTEPQEQLEPQQPPALTGVLLAPPPCKPNAQHSACASDDPSSHVLSASSSTPSGKVAMLGSSPGVGGSSPWHPVQAAFGR